MFKKHRYFLIYIFFVALTSLFFYFKSISIKNFSCTGNVNFHKNASMLRLTSKLRLLGDRGVISLNGVFIQDGSKRKSLNRDIYFSSVKDGERFTWTSIKIDPSIDENVSAQELKEWFPNFYLENDGEINLYIERINFRSIIISGELLPYLVCTKNH